MGVSSVNQVLESNGKRVLEMTLALENALLTQERNELASALDSVGDAVCILDLFGNIIYVNRAFEEMYGYAQGEVQGHEHIQILIPADPSSEVLAKDAFDGGTNRVWKGEVRRLHKDGTILDVLLTVTLLRNHAGEDIGRIGVSRSIITSKELERKPWDNEERTKEARGLSSLGELAAGVAHEIINPLAGILSLSDLIMTEILSGQVFDDVRKINWEAQRAKRVARSLVSFARNRDPVKQHLDVTNTLKEILESKAHSFRINNIQLRTEWANEVDPENWTGG